MTQNFIQTAACAIAALGLTAACASAQPAPQAPETMRSAEPIAHAAPAEVERPLSRMSPRDQAYVRDADGAPRVCETRPACHDVINAKTGRPYGSPDA
jgi:hypothetical protein